MFLLIFFEVKCVVDRYKWHRPFQMATTVLRNGNDRFKWQRPFTKGKFALALECRTKRVIPGFRPVRSLLDAVGSSESLLSVTDLASRYGIEGEICRPLNHMWQIPRLLTASNRPCQYSVRIRWLIYSREKSFYLSYGKHWSRRLQSVRTRPAKCNMHTGISFISSRISE